MGIFSNRIEKKTVKNYISEEIDSIECNINKSNDCIKGINFIIDQLSKNPKLTDNATKFYADKIIEPLQNIVRYMSSAKETFEKLKIYEQENGQFVTRSSKKSLEQVRLELKKFDDRFITLYSHALVLVQLEEEHKQRVRDEFVKTIKALKVPIHTDEKIETNNDEVAPVDTSVTD